MSCVVDCLAWEVRAVLVEPPGAAALGVIDAYAELAGLPLDILPVGVGELFPGGGGERDLLFKEEVKLVHVFLALCGIKLVVYLVEQSVHFLAAESAIVLG